MSTHLQATGSVEDVLAGLHYFRCHDHMELVALAKTLPQFLQSHPEVFSHLSLC